MRSNLTEQSKELLNSSLSMRKMLSQVFAPDMVDYIMQIIMKNESHEKFLELTKEFLTKGGDDYVDKQNQ